MTPLTAVIGTLATYYSAQFIHEVDAFLAQFAAGGFIYIAATDLMPELYKENEAKESLT